MPGSSTAGSYSRFIFTFLKLSTLISGAVEVACNLMNSERGPSFPISRAAFVVGYVADLSHSDRGKIKSQPCFILGFCNYSGLGTSFELFLSHF